MSDAPGQATYPFVEMRDKVVPDLPDNSGKEHLSIANCGHDVGGGRSTIEGQKEIFQGMMEIDGEQTQSAVAKPRANSTSDNEVDLWMKVCEQGHTNILRLHYFLETRPMIAIELVDPIGSDLVALGSIYSYDEHLIPVHELAENSRQLASAQLYLHDQKQIVHRDLKADQVLVTIDQQAKLKDFGLSERETYAFGGCVMLSSHRRRSRGKVTDQPNHMEKKLMPSAWGADVFADVIPGDVSFFFGNENNAKIVQRSMSAPVPFFCCSLISEFKTELESMLSNTVGVRNDHVSVFVMNILGDTS